MNMVLLPDRERYASLGTEALRQNYLLNGLFQPGALSLNWVDLDRTIVGGAMPTSASINLPVPDELRADTFTERREVGVMNVGGDGKVVAGEQSFELGRKDALYIGRGSGPVSFASNDAGTPAQFYLISYPAHAAHPTQVSRVADAAPLELGSELESNKRRIYKHIHAEGVQSSQLVMGFTELYPGSVWNTMPAHKHMRRSEVYLYFNLADDAAVFHLMGPPEETRHIVVKNGEAVVSPGWSIHAGCGTGNYSFIWAMGGENQDYTDMDPVPVGSIR